MKSQILIWQLITFILGVFLIMTLREYLLDKNEIEAESARAKCMAEMETAFPGKDLFAPCTDIKTYKLKISNNGY